MSKSLDASAVCMVGAEAADSGRRTRFIVFSLHSGEDTREGTGKAAVKCHRLAGRQQAVILSVLVGWRSRSQWGHWLADGCLLVS